MNQTQFSRNFALNWFGSVISHRLNKTWTNSLEQYAIKSINQKLKYKGLHNFMEWRYACSCFSTKMFFQTKTWSATKTIGGHFAASWSFRRIRVVQEECSPNPGNPAQIKGAGDWAVSMFKSNRRRNETWCYFCPKGNSRHRMDRCPEIPTGLRHTLHATRPDLRNLRNMSSMTHKWTSRTLPFKLWRTHLL